MRQNAASVPAKPGISRKLCAIHAPDRTSSEPTLRTVYTNIRVRGRALIRISGPLHLRRVISNH
jgi:hypothetical protein